MVARTTALIALLAAGCGGDDGGSGTDAAMGSDAAAADASPSEPDSSSMPLSESEPNNGNTVDEVNPIEVPVQITGAIDPQSDLDIFTAELGAGMLLRWRVESDADYAPHLAVAHGGGAAPTSVSLAPAGDSAELDQFILDESVYNIILRDVRNVGEAPEGVGGPTYSYKLVATVETPSPLSIALGGTEARSLASPFSVDLFVLSLSEETDVSITVLADRLGEPSEVDSRLSLFRPSDSAWLLTNDDLGLETLDSLAEGTLSPGDYWIVVENIAPGATDLRYELQVTQK